MESLEKREDPKKKALKELTQKLELPQTKKFIISNSLVDEEEFDAALQKLRNSDYEPLEKVLTKVFDADFDQRDIMDPDQKMPPDYEAAMNDMTHIRDLLWTVNP